MFKYSSFVLIGTSLLLATGFFYTVYSSQALENHLPPIGNFVQVDGLRLHYVDEGNGFPLVLLHGASTSLQDFTSSLLPELKQHYRVLAFDRPGHGYSERQPAHWPDPAEQAALIGKALAQLGVGRGIWIGHSWSGSVVTAALLNHPEQVIGGVLLAGGSHPWQGGVAWYNTIAETPLLGRLFAWTLVLPFGEAQITGAVESVFAPNRPSDDYIEKTAVLLSLRPSAFLANAADLARLNGFLAVQSQRYAKIQQPLLLITGADDEIVPAWNHAERLVQQAPNSQLVSLEHTGHALHHSQRERIADLILTFTGSIVRSDVRKPSSIR